MANLGDTFKERRTALGLTIDQAEAATRIRGALIRALEEGDYSRLPNPGYVRGYISSYARFLELDPHPLLQMYRAESGTKRSQDLNIPQADVAVAPRHQQHAMPVRTAIIAVVAIALLSLAVWGVMRLVSPPNPETLPEPAPIEEPTSTDPADGDALNDGTEAESPDGDAANTDAAAVQTLGTTPFTLEVKVSATGASWLEIDVDGKRAYAGTLTGGQSKRYEVSETAKVLVGRPSAVTILRDGKKQKIPASDDTPTLTLEAESTE